MTLLLSSSSRSLCSVFRTRTLLACICGAVWLPAKRRAIPVTAMSTIATRRRRFTSALYAESKASSMIVGETRRLHSEPPPGRVVSEIGILQQSMWLRSAVRTARPATRPPHSFIKFRSYPLNVLPSGFRFLDRDNPADPLIAREWRNILPFFPRRRVRNENFS